MAAPNLTAHRLRELLAYDPDTGLFTRRVRTGRTVVVGSVAGNVNPRGYVSISVDAKLYLAHRLAWLYINGSWPTGQIDHINGVRSDNRAANLRVVDQIKNSQNMRRPGSRNTSGFLGVSKRRGRWRAIIRFDGKTKQIGTFDSPQEASEAYLAAKRVAHAGCTI